jgi:N-acetylated-alpha-linked acidic dipeptidase
MTTALLRLSEAPVLPFEAGALVRHLGRYMDEIRKLKGGSGIRFDELVAETEQLRKAAQVWQDALKRSGWHSATPRSLARVNGLLYRYERALAPEPGLAGRTWYKHRIAAPGLYTGYSAKTLPAVREAVEAGRMEQANREVAPIASAVRSLRERVEEATRLLRSVQN